MNNNQPIPELRPRDIKDIIGGTPPWLTRWSITIIMLLLIAGASLSFVIQVDNTLLLPARTYYSAAQQTIYQQNGSAQIKKTYKQNGAPVAAGDTIARLQLPKNDAPVYWIANSSGTLQLPVHITNGATIAQNEHAYTIVSDTVLYAETLVPERYAGQIKPRQKAVLQLEQKQSLHITSSFAQGWTDSITALSNTAQLRIIASFGNIPKKNAAMLSNAGTATYIRFYLPRHSIARHFLGKQ